MYSIRWSLLAEITFSEEVDFILKKWNQKEVVKFGFLVHDSLESLSQNPSIGNYFLKQNIYSFVISKQTTLFYKVTVEELKIELILFWNNKKDPKFLDKYFNR